MMNSEFGRQVAVVSLMLVLVFLVQRSFLSGIKLYQLNRSAYRKRKKGETFRDWLLYTRWRNEIPRIYIVVYLVSIWFHVIAIIFCAVLDVLLKRDDIGKLITKGVIGIDWISLVIHYFMYWKPGHSSAEVPYERWIKRDRGPRKKSK